MPGRLFFCAEKTRYVSKMLLTGLAPGDTLVVEGLAIVGGTGVVLMFLPQQLKVVEALCGNELFHPWTHRLPGDRC
jgi:hypothetical protein